MLGLKDIGSLRKESAILCIPLLSFALIQDGWIGNISIFLSSQVSWIPTPVVQLLGFVIIVTLVMAVFSLLNYWVIRSAMLRADQKREEDPTHGRSIFLQWAGLLLITAGLFALSPLLGIAHTSPLNFFWHIGFLAYGYFVYDRSGN